MGSNMDQEVAARLQQEHKALRELGQVLKEHIAATPSIDSKPWLDGLRAAFDRLYEHIQRCIDMKVKDGYLDAILKERPTLARQVESIRSECPQLLKMAEGIRNELERTRPEERLLVADACARVQRFIAVVGQHEQKENMIVMFALNQDLGGLA